MQVYCVVLHFVKQPFLFFCNTITPYLDEDVDVVRDLEGHHFDLVLITHKRQVSLKGRLEQTCQNAKQL